jgi:hypothetical protein
MDWVGSKKLDCTALHPRRPHTPAGSRCLPRWHETCFPFSGPPAGVQQEEGPADPSQLPTLNQRIGEQVAALLGAMPLKELRALAAERGVAAPPKGGGQPRRVLLQALLPALRVRALGRWAGLGRAAGLSRGWEMLPCAPFGPGLGWAGPSSTPGVSWRPAWHEARCGPSLQNPGSALAAGELLPYALRPGLWRGGSDVPSASPEPVGRRSALPANRSGWCWGPYPFI